MLSSFTMQAALCFSLTDFCLGQARSSFSFPLFSCQITALHVLMAILGVPSCIALSWAVPLGLP